MKKYWVAVFIGCFFSGFVNAGAGWGGWSVNEVYSNQSGSVQYIELIAENNANANIGGSIIEFSSDGQLSSYEISGNFFNLSHFLIATQGFVQSPGSISPDLVIQGQIFDPAAMVFSINMDGNIFELNPLLLPVDDFYSIGFDENTLPNSPTNNEGEVGQLPENPIFQNGFDVCNNPIIQYRDEDMDNFGNAFNSVSACQLLPGYTTTAGDCDDNSSDVFPGSSDEPDLGFTDNNCDGIDGDLNDSVYVVKDANGSGLTPDDPMGDLMAAQQLAVDNNKSWVLVGLGNYTYGSFADGADLLAGVSLAGGYLNAFENRSQSIAFYSTLKTPYFGAELSLSLQMQTYQYLRFEGATNTPASETGYALTIRDSVDVNLEKVILMPGIGGDGISGLSGSNGANGNFGNNGGHGVENDDGFSCSTGSAPSRGSAGTSTCSRAGGRGGFAGLGTFNGSSGSPAENIGGAGGGGGVGNGNTTNRHGGDGSDGSHGSNGDSGISGTNEIVFTAFEYMISSGTDGTNGTSGRGGGGGGGGGGGALLCDSYGGAGGGGGSGGCAGTGGKGGTGGGASIALRLINASVTLEQSTLQVTSAGDGGNGGGRGFGGDGRAGGNGGNDEDDSGRGGDGGRGGNGGDGGLGGGGAGGAVIGVVCLDTATYTADPQTAFSVSGAGSGGTPGGQNGQTLIDFGCD